MSPFGSLLKHWRTTRGRSQLDLALGLGMSPRHISFLETGRSRPTQPTAWRLAEGLDLPLRERNAFFTAAGLPPPYPARDLDHPDLAPFRRVIQQMLDRHDPYPGFVIDPLYRVVEANRAARRLFGEAASPAALLLNPSLAREVVENWEQVAWALLHRLRRELPNEPGLAPLARCAEDALAGTTPPPPGTELVACPRLRLGGHVIATLSTIAHFASAMDPLASALRIELIFPADADADAFFRTSAEPA